MTARPSAMTSKTAWYRCSVTLISLMPESETHQPKYVGHITRRRGTHQPKAHWDTSAELYIFGIGAERIELSTPCLKARRACALWLRVWEAKRNGRSYGVSFRPYVDNPNLMVRRVAS